MGMAFVSNASIHPVRNEMEQNGCHAPLIFKTLAVHSRAHVLSIGLILILVYWV